MLSRWDSMASAFKSTELVYIHYVSKENFAVTLKGFNCVSLVCWEIHISYVESMDKWRRALVPVVVVNSPTEELFAGIGSPVLIRISYNRYILRREVKGFSDFSFDISCPLLSRFVLCCAVCCMTSLDYGSIELLKFTKLNTLLLRLVITAEHFAVSERIVTKTPSKIIILTLKDDQARE